MTSKMFTIFATIVPFIQLTTCQPDPPNASIPEEWEQSVAEAWDNTVIRSLRENPTHNLTGYKDWAMDQVMDGNGTINVCMRWGANETVTDALRQQILTEYTKIYEHWFQWLLGYDNFPFSQVNFKVVGWAVTDRSILEGPMEGLNVYTNFTDERGHPTCDPRCSRIGRLDDNYSGCSGGRDGRYHQFFFLDQSFGDVDMGAASGEGIDISLYGWKTVGSKMGDWSMLVHEMGHTFGLLDYLDDGLRNHTICENTWLPPNASAELVMKPGDNGAHVPRVTEFEGWLLRYFWSRFSSLRGWQKSKTTYPPPPDCPIGVNP
ncbi:hypothetical protein GQ53DRAFT_746178 [Thozetella sp. PMI_491]|nr:hypothetical protein GQ53DRAFT_746178 [Thozetella sp. PMI_491]